METKFNINISCFPGFYESILENSDTEWNEAEYLVEGYHENYPGFNVERGDCEFDYRGYENAVSEAFVSRYAELYPCDIVLNCTYESVIPPRNTGYGPDYRFGTDRLYVDVELAEDWFDQMVRFIDSNKDWFQERILADWSSRDGFMSFMENDIDAWKRELETGDSRYVGQTLDYIVMFNNNTSRSDLCESVCIDVLDCVGAYEYMGLSEEKEAEFNEYIKAEEEKKKIKEWEDKHQLKLDFGE